MLLEEESVVSNLLPQAASTSCFHSDLYPFIFTHSSLYQSSFLLLILSPLSQDYSIEPAFPHHTVLPIQ